MKKYQLKCVSLSGCSFEVGATKLKGEGGYSGRDKTIVYFVVNRFQVARLKEIVHETDPHAFITISEVADVFTSQHDK